VAGGGGGAGYNYSTFNYDRGGDGGGVTGEKGFGAGNNTGTQGGGGGTSSAGGGAATYSCVNAAGALGIGEMFRPLVIPAVAVAATMAAVQVAMAAAAAVRLIPMLSLHPMLHIRKARMKPAMAR
jgi:hypothetical protein